MDRLVIILGEVLYLSIIYQTSAWKEMLLNSGTFHYQLGAKRKLKKRGK